jgi:hypothetical protein
VLELRPAKLSVIRVLADDWQRKLVDVAGSVTCGVASDEVLLLCEPNRATSVAESVRSSLADGTTLTLDDSDSFACWWLAGDRVDDALARLSEIRLPADRPSFFQGLVAGVPAKVMLEAESALVLVSSSLSHHFRVRTLTACEAFEIDERLTSLIASSFLSGTR